MAWTCDWNNMRAKVKNFKLPQWPRYKYLTRVWRSNGAIQHQTHDESQRWLFSSNAHNLPLVTISALFMWALSVRETDYLRKGKNASLQKTALTSKTCREPNMGGKNDLLMPSVSSQDGLFLWQGNWRSRCYGKCVSTPEVINDFLQIDRSTCPGTCDCSLQSSIKRKLQLWLLQ